MLHFRISSIINDHSCLLLFSSFILHFFLHISVDHSNHCVQLKLCYFLQVKWANSSLMPTQVSYCFPSECSRLSVIYLVLLSFQPHCSSHWTKLHWPDSHSVLCPGGSLCLGWLFHISCLVTSNSGFISSRCYSRD